MWLVTVAVYSAAGNAVILLFIALLYFYRVEEDKVIHRSVYPVDFLYIIVGLELLFTLPCLVYYIGIYVTSQDRVLFLPRVDFLCVVQ